jgi:hypothetical protein
MKIRPKKAVKEHLTRSRLPQKKLTCIEAANGQEPSVLQPKDQDKVRNIVRRIQHSAMDRAPER